VLNGDWEDDVFITFPKLIKIQKDNCKVCGKEVSESSRKNLQTELKA
jgi:hypothetical protein